MLPEKQSPSQASLFPSVNNLFSTHVKHVSADTWHFQLGHVSKSRLKLLHDIIPSITCDSDTHCNIFPLAKQR